MYGKTVFIASRDKRGVRRLAARLRGARNRTLVIDDPKAVATLVAANAGDLLLVDCSDPEYADDLLSLMSGGVPVIALSPRGGAHALARLYCDHAVDHLICGEADNDEGIAGIDGGQVVTTVEKILRNDLFGLEKYMSDFRVELLGCTISHARERDDLMRVINTYLGEVGCSRRVTARISTLVDELLTNAIYNAPRDRYGWPLHAATDRREKVSLAQGQEVVIRFGCDGEKFGISVTDPFGSLDAEALRSSLRRCLLEDQQIDQKEGGAGLGLYTSFMSCRELVFNIEPGVRTEVIAIADVGRGSRDLVSRAPGLERSPQPPSLAEGRSLHVFTSDGELSADQIASVILSDAMRGEIIELVADLPPAPQRRRRRSDCQTLRVRRPRGSDRQRATSQAN